MNFEVCAVNLQSALAAQQAGAHRIELCSALDVGGLTPSLGLVRAVVDALEIPVHVLIRVREGGFCYTEEEFKIMLEDIRLCREAGAAGVVVGALTPDGKLNIPQMRAFKQAAGVLDLTCHRAFDFVENASEALETLIELGFVRVLSSGQAQTAFEGRVLLQQLIQQAQNRIAVMPGGGISAENIRAIAEFTGANDVHFSGKKKVWTKNSCELSGLAFWHWQSDETLLQETILACPPQL
jgi:copper homeostasis protein